MSKLQNKDIDRLFEAILTLESVEECYNFFEDACTVKELLDIAQRLKAAEMLNFSQPTVSTQIQMLEEEN